MNENPNWERELLEKLAMAALTEQRRSRRWKIFFRLIWLTIIGAVCLKLFLLKGDGTSVGLKGVTGHTAVLKLEGIINSENNTANKMIQGLRDAYDDKGTRGILIHANSPGGSPVLSGMVYDEIRRLKKLHPSVPVSVVVDEICLSGCYYIAAAADKIYVDKASLVGSIGVVYSSFGFTGLMEKLGIDRRLQTAGANKVTGDPFLPVDPKHVLIRQQQIETIHQQFIKAVEEGRGKRLKPTPDMFSGLFWVGANSLSLGLADDYGTVDSVARDVIKAERIVDVTPDDSPPSRLARRLGLEFGNGIKGLFASPLF